MEAGREGRRERGRDRKREREGGITPMNVRYKCTSNQPSILISCWVGSEEMRLMYFYLKKFTCCGIVQNFDKKDLLL